MTHQTVLLHDVFGEFKGVDLGVWLAFEPESRFAFDKLTDAGLGDEVGIVARIFDGDEHTTITWLATPESIEVAGSQQVA